MCKPNEEHFLNSYFCSLYDFIGWIIKKYKKKSLQLFKTKITTFFLFKSPWPCILKKSSSQKHIFRAIRLQRVATTFSKVFKSIFLDIVVWRIKRRVLNTELKYRLDCSRKKHRCNISFFFNENNCRTLNTCASVMRGSSNRMVYS